MASNLLGAQCQHDQHGYPLILEAHAEVKCGWSAEQFLERLQEKGDHAASLEQHLAWLDEAGLNAAGQHLHLNRAVLAGIKPSGASSSTWPDVASTPATDIQR